MAPRTRVGGNFVSEWFGQRVYPPVRLDASQLVGNNSGRCTFLSKVLEKPTACVKNANSAGVCSVSSSSNGVRQDWLVCPYRVIDSEIVQQSCRRIFGLKRPVRPTPVVMLDQQDAAQAFAEATERSGAGYLFFQDKLGGEISVVGSQHSPELSFDITLVEVRPSGSGRFQISRYGILELQTMDYHGTYKHAVDNLRDGLRLHGDSFAAALRANLEHWAGKGVEGPNIANVFKRTFYQVLMKFKLADGEGGAAGTVLALPRSVWESWQPFLGAPGLEPDGPGLQRLKVDPDTVQEAAVNAYICVFDVDATSRAPVSPVRVDSFIHVSPERLAHHAFTVVPQTILNSIRTDASILSRIHFRLTRWWSQIDAPTGPTARRQRV